jgi:hypothetical protein
MLRCMFYHSYFIIELKINNLKQEAHLNNIYKSPVLTSKETQHLSITKIDWLTVFKDIIAVYSENHTKRIKRYMQWAKCRINDCENSW